MSKFDMAEYSRYNRALLESPDYPYTTKLVTGLRLYETNKLEAVPGEKPLAPNNRLLLEIIYGMRPSSVFELGVGCGDNLFNIWTILPHAHVCGFDASVDQIRWLEERNPTLADYVWLWDAGWPRSMHNRSVDVAFSLTVLMHIECDYAYLNALACLFWYAEHAVILIENWETRNYAADIHGMRQRGMLPPRWDSGPVYYYYRESPELERPQALIVSLYQLPYPKLDIEDYNKVFVLPQHSDETGRLPGSKPGFPKPFFEEKRL